jgi:hypothetical protein
MNHVVDHDSDTAIAVGAEPYKAHAASNRQVLARTRGAVVGVKDIIPN